MVDQIRVWAMCFLNYVAILYICPVVLKATPTSDLKTILCVGDSITTGAGSSSQIYNYPSQLSRLLNGDVANSGVHYDVINLGKVY